MMRTLLSLAFVCLIHFLGGIGEENMRSSYFNMMPHHRLTGHLITTTTADSELTCAQKCLRNEQCKSCNFQAIPQKNGICQLNSKTLRSQTYDPALIYDENFVFISLENEYYDEIPKGGDVSQKPACSNAPSLGVAYGGRIPDSSFSATSSYNYAWLPKYGRLHGPRQGWAPKPLNNMPNEYLQIDLGGEYWICGVATQGEGSGSSSDEWSTKFKLNLSVDIDSNWNIYQWNGSDKEFIGNTDINTVVKNTLPSAARARYIRFIPTAAAGLGWPALRVDVFGWSV